MSERKKRYLLYSVLVVYIVLHVLGIFLHEPWRDEAQSYLLIRDLSLPGLLQMMSSEGHSCMWLLLSWPFVKLGCGIYIQNVISVLLCTAAAWWLLFKSPFKLGLKILLVFGSGLMYHYAVIARCYALIPIILFLLAFCFSSRKTHPYRYCFLIMLLVQTHLYMLMTAFLLSLFFFGDLAEEAWTQRRLKILFPLLLPLGSALLLLWQITPFYSSVHPFSLEDLVHFMFVPFSRIISSPILSIITFIAVYAGLILLMFFSHQREIKTVGWVVAGSLLFQAFIFSVRDYTILPHVLLFIFWIIWGGWVLLALAPKQLVFRAQLANTQVFSQSRRGRWKAIVLAVNCLLIWLGVWGIKQNVSIYIQDALLPYSGGKSTAAFVNAHCEPSAVLLTSGSPLFSSVVPFLTEHRYLKDVSTGNDFSFIQWNKPYYLYDEQDHPEQLVQQIEQMTQSYSQAPRPICLITLSLMSKRIETLPHWQKIYSSSDFIMTSEVFDVFRYKAENK